MDWKRSKADLFQGIARDTNLREEVLEHVFQRDAGRAAGDDEQESLSPAGSAVDRAARVFAGTSHDPEMEAIILLEARPVIRVFRNDLRDEDIPTETLKAELAPHRDTIRALVQSVGRIELSGHARLAWVGTGWVVDEEMIATNRHVAREFGGLNDATFSFLPAVFGGSITARIDFLQEHLNAERLEFAISEILHVEPDGGPDLAFLKVDWTAGRPRDVLRLSPAPLADDQKVVVIGYPAKDTRTDIPSKMDEIFDNIYNVKRFAPGEVITHSDSAGLMTHDCTTLGGNSGSSVVDLATGQVVGLHFAGREQEANFAVLASVVAARLDQVKRGTFVPGIDRDFTNEVVEETPSLDQMAGRDGYQTGFLGTPVELPRMPAALRDEVAPVEANADGVLAYTHHSVVMHRTRRVAIYAVVNIDGRHLHGVPRGSDKWYFDPRLNADHQVGNELYRSNPLDRGHLVRRLDPAWGESRDEAERAVEDSFFYTNCVPQHLTLNRNLWLGLEDHILNNTDVHDLKVTVFSGPVLRDDDKRYRNIGIPNEFWKVVAMVKSDGGLSATGYVLSQRSLIDGLEFVFGEHQGYQVPLRLIEELTGLDFGMLRRADPLESLSDDESRALGATPRGKRLRTYRDIVV